MTVGSSISSWPVDARILAALRSNPSASGADLAHELGITRAAVWARIQELRNLGYEISASPHGGYQLITVPDVLHADDLLSRIGPGNVVGREIRVFKETTSTNDVVEKLARDGVGEGVVVFAESQSKGRGRLGRQWISPAGQGLWFSLLLRPRLAPQECTRLTVAAAVALRRAMHQMAGVPVEIKWPNDILVQGRKIAGILTEMQAELDRVKHVILGIGVDVNQRGADFPVALRAEATSLRQATGRAVARADLAAAILVELDRDYARVVRGNFAAVADEWEAHCATLGRQVRIAVGSRTLRGRAESLDCDGALLLRTQHGHLERVLGGDVTLEK